jgi:hypothetical protein
MDWFPYNHEIGMKEVVIDNIITQMKGGYKNNEI